MLEPQPWDDPRGSFQRPLPPPTAGPQDLPLCVIEVNESWLPFVLGALKQLLLPETWIGNYDDRVFVTTLVATWIGTLTCLEIPFAICDFDFLPSTDGWHLAEEPDHGEWFVDVGWVGNVRIDDNNSSQAYIEYTTFINELTHFEAHVTADENGEGVNAVVNLFVVRGGVLTVIASSPMVAGSTTISWDGSEINVEALRIATNLGEITSTTVIESAQFAGHTINGCGSF